ncbi:MAG: type II toxin-antitoxin system VapB family antitoxin [Promicromonosporaceae bacterium]|nr:type II toxin-antitoxin system VapB family antitoxin [Promicromonosporaceae bacterium]
MSLNIKNPEVTDLVRELASRTGLSQTAAVRSAVEFRLAELDSQQPADDGRIAQREAAVDALLKEIWSRSQPDPGFRNRMDAELYDEYGLYR